MKKTIFILLLATGLATGASAQTNVNTLLWKISRPGSSIAPSYLFGTIHMAQRAFLNFTDSLYEAINNTDAFYGELDYSKNMMSEMLANSEYFASFSAHIDSLTKTENWKRMVEKLNKKYGTDIDPENIEDFTRFRQKQLSSDIFKADSGVSKVVDMLLGDHAASLGKKIGGLETFKLQFTMIYNMLDLMVADTSISMSQDSLLNSGLIRYYKTERLDSMTLFIGNINPSYRDIILNNRNKTMADSIEKIIGEGPAFFAVGCGHLVTDKGLISLLRQRGFILTPVHSDNRISLLLINSIKENYKQTLDKEKKDSENEPDDTAKKIMEQLQRSMDKLKTQEVKPRTLPVKKKVVKKKTKSS